MMIANMIRINQRREIEENIFSKKCDLTLEINNIEKINELKNKYDAAKNKTVNYPPPKRGGLLLNSSPD